jgi:hypothetical protein
MISLLDVMPCSCCLSHCWLLLGLLVSLLEAFLANTHAVVVVLMGVAYAYYVKMNAVAKKMDL